MKVYKCKYNNIPISIAVRQWQNEFPSYGWYPVR